MRRLLLVAAGAVAAGGALRVARSGGLARTNFRGRSVSLAGGPALAAAASLTAAAGAGSAPAAAAALVAGLGSGAVGRYDDVVGGQQVDALVALFEGLWRAAVPLPTATQNPSEEMTARSNQVLALLT